METKDKIVPIEPTDEMARQGALNVSCLTREGAKACYRAMVYAAPEAAALSVQKQLVEALEALLPIAEVGEYLTEAHSYSYGDGYSQPFEYGIDWQWQQSSPDLKHGPFALQADVDSWIKEQIENAKDDEVECILESVKARAAIQAAKASS